MNKRFFVDDVITDEGKYRVVQEDTETKDRFGIKDCDTKEEAQSIADDMQRAIDNSLSETSAGKLEDAPVFHKSDAAYGNKYKDTLQDLKNETSQD